MNSNKVSITLTNIERPGYVELPAGIYPFHSLVDECWGSFLSDIFKEIFLVTRVTGLEFAGCSFWIIDISIIWNPASSKRVIPWCDCRASNIDPVNGL